ncbi:MAG: UbiA family prenyltransferase [Rhodospirillales bacterium]|nr:UbiA family prenyltransferase [Rhodospirillales bacterium]
MKSAVGRPPSVSWRDVWIDRLVAPVITAPTAAAPVIVATGLAMHDGVFAALPVLLAFLSSWLIHVAGIFADYYVLLFRHPEDREHPDLVSALKSGMLTLHRLRAAIIGCLALAVVAGAWLAVPAGIAAPALGAVGIAASLGYAAGPWPMTRLGIADPVFFVMFGIVAVAGTYYVQAVSLHAPHLPLGIVTAALPASAFIVGLPAGALVTNQMLIDDIRDRTFDIAKGWRTMPVRHGLGWARAEFVGLTACVYLVPFWLWLGMDFSPWVLLCWLTFPQAADMAHGVLTEDSLEKLLPFATRWARLTLDHSVLLAIGIAVRHG